jgi:TATA-box binding protein (TBP) (component of TFIID and TFIIIB)
MTTDIESSNERRMNVLREFDIGLELEEFEGLDGDEMDDLQNELFGADEFDDDDDDENEEEGLDDDGPNGDDNDADVVPISANESRTAIARATARRRAANDERVERLRAEEELERKLGFTQPVKRCVIELRKQRPYEWWFSRRGAQTMYDEDRHADEIVLSRVERSLSSVPPPTGLRRVFELPKTLDEIVLEPYMLFTTTEVIDTNSVATFYTGLLYNLNDVAHRSVVFCFNLRRFAACKTTMEEGTVLLFCGSAVCTGPKGAAQSNAQCQRYVLWLNQLGIPATMQGYRLQNLVSKASAGHGIELGDLHAKYPFNAQYKPKRFPAVIFRIGDFIVVIVFKSGKVIITGSKLRQQTRLVWTFFQNKILREFKSSASDVHVTEAAFRRQVVEEQVTINYTCEKISQIFRERALMERMENRNEEEEAMSRIGSLAAKARDSRKRPFSEVIGDVLLENERTPIAHYLDEMVTPQMRSGEQFIADWLAKNKIT